MRARLYDAGTRLVIDSSGTTPGMDNAYYRELDMEYNFKDQQERIPQINKELREAPLGVDLRPWPVAFPGRCWIDHTNRYETELGGPRLQLLHHDHYTGEFDPVPSPYCQLENSGDYKPLETVGSERMADTLTVDELAAIDTHPTQWLRLPLGNEVGGRYGGQCDLKEPSVMVFRGLSGPDYRLKVDYNDLFMPVDLSHAEWYDVEDDDGNVLSEDAKLAVLGLRDGGFYHLYLRPANWRWVGTVWATYLYVSWFEMFYTSLAYTTAWFNRPPIYPYRHDFVHTVSNPIWEYRSVYYSLDPGISDGFNSSEGAAFLRWQILDAQWYTMSEAFIYAGNDEAILTLWKYPPNPGDFVAAIGRVDQPGGDEQVFWLKQKVDLESEWPRAVIGQYAILDFYAA